MTINGDMLLLSLALLLLFQLVQGLHTSVNHGLPYSLSSRDKPVDLGLTGGRIQRAKINLIENLMLFAPVSILGELMQVNHSLVNVGAIIFFVSRIVHAVTYIAGISVIRTISWLTGLVGCVLIGLAVVGWA